MQELIDGKQAWPIYDFIAILCLVLCLSFMPKARGQAPFVCAAPSGAETYGWVNINLNRRAQIGLTRGDYVLAMYDGVNGPTCAGQFHYVTRLHVNIVAIIAEPHFPFQLSAPADGEIYLVVYRTSTSTFYNVQATTRDRGRAPWSYATEYGESQWPTDSIRVGQLRVTTPISDPVVPLATSFALLPPHPNPATNTITIGRAFVLYNVLGRRVMEGGGGTYDVSALAAGIYIVAYLDEGESTAITIL